MNVRAFPLAALVFVPAFAFTSAATDGPAADLHGFLFVPHHAHAGDEVLLSASFLNRGDLDAPLATYTLSLDGLVIASRRVAIPAGGYALLSAPWTATEGDHTLQGVADADGEVPETNESDNVFSATFRTTLRPTPADLSIEIVSIVRPAIATTAGPIPIDPVGRYRIGVEACNAGPGEAPRPWVILSVETGKDLPDVEPTSSVVGAGFWSPLAVGECLRQTYSWMPEGEVGDVEFRALGISGVGDPDPSDDTHRRASFVLVEGMGGFNAVHILGRALF